MQSGVIGIAVKSLESKMICLAFSTTFVCVAETQRERLFRVRDSLQQACSTPHWELKHIEYSKSQITYSLTNVTFVHKELSV